MKASPLIRNGLIGLALMMFAGAGFGAATANAETWSRAFRYGSQAKYEAWLSNQVHYRLATIPWYGVFDNLQYQIDGRRVILLGQVVNPVMSSEAESSVKSIAGVTQVENKIQVLPLSPFDNQTRWAEYRAIFSEPSLSRYSMGAIPSIHIIVDNGHVTLVGYVNSKMDRDLAGMRARQVPDVFSVTNDLRVTHS